MEITLIIVTIYYTCSFSQKLTGKDSEEVSFKSDSNFSCLTRHVSVFICHRKSSIGTFENDHQLVAHL